MKKREEKLGGVTAEQKEVLERFWKGFPVVEADFDLHLFITEEDTKGAVPKSFTQCVRSRAFQRMTGNKKALIATFASITYAGPIEYEGKQVILRFLNQSGRKSIAKYDTTGEWDKLGLHILKRVTPGRTAEHQRQWRRESRARIKEATIKGVAVEKKPYKRSWRVLGEGKLVRDGVGQVHFIRKNGKGPEARA